MHSPDEEAPEEQRGVNNRPAQQEVPLYEFPAGPETRVLPEASSGSTPANEPAAQGFVYPPPPSFYEQMATPLQRVPLPGAGGVAHAPAPPVPGDAQVYPPAAAPSLLPPVKKSRRWLWIMMTLVGVILLASCGLCSWSAYNFISPLYQQLSGSINVVNDYYTNLQARNYHAAYSDLAPRGRISGLSEQQFSSEASGRDSSYGVIDSFVLGQPAFRTDPDTGPDLSHFTMSVDIKRSHLSYSTVLSMAKVGNVWKITDYSQL
jgi:hypothetical protein